MGFLVNYKGNFDTVNPKIGKSKKKERTNYGASAEGLLDPKRFAFDTS